MTARQKRLCGPLITIGVCIALVPVTAFLVHILNANSGIQDSFKHEVVACAILLSLFCAITLAVCPFGLHSPAELTAIASRLQAGEAAPVHRSRVPAFMHRLWFQEAVAMAVLAAVFTALRNGDARGDTGVIVALGVMVALCISIAIALGRSIRTSMLTHETFRLFVILFRQDERFELAQEGTTVKVYTYRTDPHQLVTISGDSYRSNGADTPEIVNQHWATANRGRALLAA
jgi:hypothetical protein